MKIVITSTEAARNLGEYLARIKHRGDRFVITRNNRPVAELGPVSGARETSLAELWSAMREVLPDEEFAADLQRANESDTALGNPWES